MNFYPPGYRIADRYKVAGRPLMGGMGIVYLCAVTQSVSILAGGRQPYSSG